MDSNVDHFNEHDCCQLSITSDSELLKHLKIRFEQNQIYTHISKLLLAVNPRKEIANLYNEAAKKKYLKESLEILAPHVYGIAKIAVRSLQTSKKQQTILILGESGSGKTESTKHIIEFLCELSQNEIIDSISETQKILEEFGNARTTVNQNSSRFTKVIQIHYNENMRVIGGTTQTLFLETNRACFRKNQEESFHIFSLLLSGAPFEMRKMLFPDKYYEKFEITNQSTEDDFFKIQRYLLKVGMAEDQCANVFKLVALVLHIDNIDFEEDSNHVSKISDKSMDTLKIISQLMHVTDLDLSILLTTRSVEIPGPEGSSTINIPLDRCTSEKLRDTLAKTIYAYTFDEISDSISPKILPNSSEYQINILDIAGFECFNKSNNAFEQFCINFINEKFQQFSVKILIEDEQLWYQEEKLNLPIVPFFDNSAILDLFENRLGGILHYLDDECKLLKPSLQHLLTKVHATWNGSSAYRQANLKDIDCKNTTLEFAFIIKHFANDVCYNSEQFIEKNREILPPKLTNVVLNVMRSFGFGSRSKLHLNNNFRSVSRSMRIELSKILKDLSNTELNFVRCIKPTMSPTETSFDENYVLEQLRSSSTIALYYLMQYGFPYKLKIDDIVQQFDKYSFKSVSKRVFVEIYIRLRGYMEKEYKIGATKIFLRNKKGVDIESITNSDDENFLNELKNEITWSKFRIIRHCLHFMFILSKRVKMSKVPSLVESRELCDSPKLLYIQNTTNICVPVKRKSIESSTNSRRKSLKVRDNSDQPKNIQKTNETRPDSSMQYDRLDHLPEIDKNKNSTRCKMSNCKSKSHVFCTKCMVHLCFVGGRNCFLKFHTPTKVEIGGVEKN